MVLLFNVFITHKSANGGFWDKQNVSYDRGNLSTPNKIDVVKYALSSTAKAYPWKRAIIKVELDSEFSSEKEKADLEAFVREEFKDTELFFFNVRNKFQEDWIETYDLINDDFIYYQGNHDHIFFNASNEYLKSIVDEIRQDGDYKYKTIVTSHWCEIIRAAKCGYIKPYWLGGPPQHDQYYPTQFHKNYNEKDNFVTFDGSAFDSYNIITKDLYHNWFLEGDWNVLSVKKSIFPTGRLELPRTEGVGIVGMNELKNTFLKVPTPIQKMYAPYEEVFRHFDGHFHQKISNDICPAIDIPVGYFEKQMKIRYGYDDYKEGWTNINPKNDHYYAFDKTGTDYKFTLNDLPYIWKDRIVEVDSNPNISDEEMVQYRLKSILETIYNDSRYNQHINESIKDKILNQYLKRYPEFSL
jgi:hypothetical protein